MASGWAGDGAVQDQIDSTIDDAVARARRELPITSTEHRPLNRTTCERLTMKNIKYAAAAIALTALSFGAFAAEPVTPAQAESMNKIGVVSAQGATTLDGLEAKLAAKAEAAGATGYSITSANTNNKLSGTAVIYK
ncbi:hypothetical protein KAM622c_34690 [Klebsiella quasipneumoniae subsp. quasipneumoniae]|nr:hypothetical protein KAM622c_34690 [Klebsiella quasipneumoniae subsp. quasipneumoniae]